MRITISDMKLGLVTAVLAYLSINSQCYKFPNSFISKGIRQNRASEIPCYNDTKPRRNLSDKHFLPPQWYSRCLEGCVE